MSVSDQEIAGRTGATIKGLRQKADLSMRELAERAGISQPFLSQIERGVSAPSLATIYRLAEALSVPPGRLLPEMAPSPVEVVRADEGVRVPVADHPRAVIGRGLVFRKDSPIEVVEYVVRPGDYIEEQYKTVGVCGLYLVSGSLLVEIEDEEPITLGARDFVRFPAGVHDRWRHLGDEPAHILFLVWTDEA